MFRLPRLSRRLLAAGGVAAVAALGAATTPVAALSFQPPAPCGPFWAMECTGAAQPVQNGSDSTTETVAYSCVAETTFTEVSTTGSVGVSCYLHGLTNKLNYTGFEIDRGTNQSAVWTNGVASTLTGELSLPVQPYQLCVAGGYFVDGTFNAIGNYACSQLNF
jgi:hypothetical protein